MDFIGFKDFFYKLREETTSGDIATVDNKLGSVKQKKRCKKHNRYDCPECKEIK